MRTTFDGIGIAIAKPSTDERRGRGKEKGKGRRTEKNRPNRKGEIYERN